MSKRYLKAFPSLMPLPAAVVTVSSSRGDNPITISWIGVLCSVPPLIGFSIRDNRHSFKVLEDAEDFVVNIPWEQNLKAVDICGQVSGKDQDKWELSEITKEKSKIVKSVAIAEFPMNIECILREKKLLGSHTLFIGEIVSVSADERLFGADGNIDIERILPVGYMPQTKTYYATGKKLERAGYTIKK